ncbi:MAG: SGNH/GDSL hydrolase family protein [Acidobacteria bacterium]|nr:SGNH/GDSL hydrolase family protein [Acidobacteriota bacterium]
MDNNGDNLRRWQRKFLLGAAMIAPIAPFLLLQGQIVRWKVGVLPDAEGDKFGRYGEGENAAKLFVIGESTVAGLGARNHKLALAGQFAKYLSEHIHRPVDWNVIGKNGVTARRTIEELMPHMPDGKFDYILVGLGGNDVMKISSPEKWRRDMIELLGILREKSPNAIIFLSNCPMIIHSPIMPFPIKPILWNLSQMHNDNIKEFTRDIDRVFYYPQPVDVRLEGFFADGLHPSEQGYRDWAEAMIRYFVANYKW